MKIKSIEPLVEEALTTNPASRGDNYILYMEVLSHYINVNCISFASLCRNHEALGVPSLESITRARRKLQETHPEYRPNDAIIGERERMEREAREYALCIENGD